MKKEDTQIKRQWVTIADAARFLGVSQDTLRRWEKKGTLIPRRTVGSHRRYSRVQLERILLQPTSQVLDRNIVEDNKTILNIPTPVAVTVPKPIPYQSKDNNILQNITLVIKGNILSLVIAILIVSLLIASYILLQITREQSEEPLSPVPSYKTLQLP